MVILNFLKIVPYLNIFKPIEYIRNETDDQDDDLISIDQDTIHDEAEFRGDLSKIEDSLNDNVPVTIGEVNGSNRIINVGTYFNNPINIREYLPELANDPYTNDVLIVSESSFPDRTFSGILPEKWPTKRNVYIDKVRVWGLEDNFTSLLYLKVVGLAPWDINSIKVYSQNFWKPFEFNDMSPYTDRFSGDQWFMENIMDAYNGNYKFRLKDKDNNAFDKSKYFTRNMLTISGTPFSPSDNEFVDTTTPTFVLPDLSNTGSSVQLYYNIMIIKPFSYKTGKSVLHQTITPNNQWTVPENILSPDTLYTWNAFIIDAKNIEMEKAGEITSYSIAYTYSEIPIAQDLTVSKENDYIYTSMPTFSWSPVTLNGNSFHSNIQIYQYGSADNLVYSGFVTVRKYRIEYPSILIMFF